jgi:predicted lipid-binding transport protein (Tim44 family)
MSVRFTGLLREDGTVLPKDFDEIWNLVKPVDGSSGWLLAGIQQTHALA